MVSHSKIVIFKSYKLKLFICILQSQANAAILFSLGYCSFDANPNFSNATINIHVISIYHHFKPCLTELSNAWWLLCHPSPRARTPTKGLFIEISPVLNAYLPQMWDTELTLHCTCHKTTCLMANPQNMALNPPRA